MEVWKKFRDTYYEVSCEGRVRSHYKSSENVPPKLLKPLKNEYGYYKVSVRMGKTQKYMLISRMVLEAFTGPIPKGLDAAHLNGNKADNRLVNLLACTREENNRHKKLHGTQSRGESMPWAKLKEEEVKQIIELLKTNITQVEIAKKFNVNPMTIFSIKHGKNWSHLTKTGEKHGE